MRYFLLLLVLGLVTGAVVFQFKAFEKRSTFFPDKQVEYYPGDIGLEYKEVYFQASDKVTINAWFVKCPGAYHTILFCHGNAGNISHRLDKLKFFHSLGCNILIFDYRGYGKSRGVPSEAGFYRDVYAAYQYLLSQGLEPKQIIGYGESIGGAVIIDLAGGNDLGGMIIDSTFSSARDMAGVIFPYLPAWIISSRWDSESKVKSILCPKLFIHSREDEIVPYRLGKKVFDSAVSPKEFIEIRGNHNYGFFEAEEILKEKIGGFIKGIEK